MSASAVFRIHLFSLTVGLCLLSGCVAGGGPIRYYRIEVPSQPAVNAAPGFGVTLQVGTLDAPPIMRDGRILYQMGAHEVGAYEYHRWVEPPDRIVQDALLRMLRATGKYQSVDTTRSGVRADYILQGRIYEFSEVDKPEVYSRVFLELELHDARNFRTVWSRVYDNEDRVEGKAVPEVVDSLDRNLRRGISEVVSGLDQFFTAKTVAAKPLP